MWKWKQKRALVHVGANNLPVLAWPQQMARYCKEGRTCQSMELADLPNAS
jgi:hypothetical protein